VADVVRDRDIILTSKISQTDFSKYCSKSIDDGINSADAVQIEFKPESVNEMFPEEHEQSNQTVDSTVTESRRILGDSNPDKEDALSHNIVESPLESSAILTQKEECPSASEVKETSELEFYDWRLFNF
jgi:hypothetical protein